MSVIEDKGVIGRIGGVARQALGGIAWDPSLHPRDDQGRFVDTPDVTVNGKRGRAISQVGDTVTVETDEGRIDVPAADVRDATISEPAAAVLTPKPEAPKPEPDERTQAAAEDRAAAADAIRRRAERARTPIAADRATPNPDQTTLFGDDFPDPLDTVLVNYKPDRNLADPNQVTRLTTLLPDAEYVPYSQVPFLDGMHDRMMLDPEDVTRIVDSGDRDQLTSYLDKRQAMFDSLPLSKVPLDQVVVTQPTVNAARVQEIIEDPSTGGSKPLFFVRSGGKTYVMNGHHRIAAMLRQGDTEATGRVLDLDADPSTPAGYAAEYLRYRALAKKAKNGEPGVTWDVVNEVADRLLNANPPAGFDGTGTRTADGKPYGSGYPSYDPRSDPWYDEYVEDLERRISEVNHPTGDVTTGTGRRVRLSKEPAPHGGVVVGKVWDTQAKHTSRTRTGKMRTDPDTGLPVYHKDRDALHQQIIDEVLDDAAARGVPRDRKAVFMAGPSGAGKSTAIAQHGREFGVIPGTNADGKPDPEHPDNFVVLNPDIVKERMIQLGMLDPDMLNGVSPDEAVTFLHEESSDVTKMIRAALWDEGYNVLIDGTFAASAKDPDKKKKEVLEYASHGYTSVGVLLDGTLDNSYVGAGRRHRQVPATPGERLPGRYIPYVTLRAQAPTGAVSTTRTDPDGEPLVFRSYNAETFEGAADQFDKQWIYVVENGNATLMWVSQDDLAAMEGKGVTVTETKAGGLDRNRGGAEKLRAYWTRGPGAAKIGWGTPGDWKRCVAHLSKYMGPRAKGYCNLRHREATGVYTGSRLNPGNAKGLPRLDDWIQVKADPGDPTAPHDTGGQDTVMVAFYLPAHAAVELEPLADRAAGDLHVTLAVLATPASQMEPADVDRLLDLVEGFAAESLDIVGTINGSAALSTPQGRANVLLLDSPDLPAFHGDLCDELDDAGFTRSDAHGFTPHITLNIDGDPAPEPPNLPVVFGLLSVAVGDDVWDFPLAADDNGAPEGEDEEEESPAEEAAEPEPEEEPEEKGRPLIDVLADFGLDWEEKRTFTQAQRDSAASSGHALPDGSYPIESEQDLRNAIQAIGRAKDPAKAKAHIKKRARALGLSDLIPEGW